MIAVYSCFSSQAFPLLLLTVTLLFSFGAFVFKGKRVLLIFISCCLFLRLVQSIFKGKAVRTHPLYFTSALSDSALHRLSWREHMRSVPVPWVQAAVVV